MENLIIVIFYVSLLLFMAMASYFALGWSWF
jgi:hypothetical protein